MRNTPQSSRRQTKESDDNEPFSPGFVLECDDDKGREVEGGRCASPAFLSRRTTPPAGPFASALRRAPRRDGRDQWCGKGEWDGDPVHGDDRGPVRARVCYAPFTLLRLLTLHCTRKGGVAEGGGAQQTERGVADGKRRSGREGAQRTTRRGRPWPRATRPDPAPTGATRADPRPRAAVSGEKGSMSLAAVNSYCRSLLRPPKGRRHHARQFCQGSRVRAA